MEISLFITCFNDSLFPETGKDMVELFERLGHTIKFPSEQTCCGQMHFNTGYQKETIPLVRHFVKTFEDAEVIVSPSASCVGMVTFVVMVSKPIRDEYVDGEDYKGLETHVKNTLEMIARIRK